MIEETVDITTADGPMETFVCRPERGGPCPAVFFLMDAHGIREELRDMARRLATVGYYVLLPNLYYRAGRDTIFGPDVSEEGSPEHTRMRAVRTTMTIPPVMHDVAAMLAFVDRQDAVKLNGNGINPLMTNVGVSDVWETWMIRDDTTNLNSGANTIQIFTPPTTDDFVIDNVAIFGMCRTRPYRQAGRLYLPAVGNICEPPQQAESGSMSPI
jgi:Dienelactone hydrolase family